MKKQTIALGTDDFKKVIDGNHYLVDKSLFIKEAIEDGASVVLMPRPRRWGKTLNMTMLKYFFEKTEHSNRHLFNGLAVEKHSDIMEHQGKYPVIFLTLKDTKQLCWNECFALLKSAIVREYQNHIYLLNSPTLTEPDKDRFNTILNRLGELNLYKESLRDLCAHLHRYHGIEPIVLIDEYDAPVISGFENGYYKEIVSFMQTFLGAAFKTNPHLKKGFLTGILRVSKESIFSGINNLSVCSLLSTQYSEYFGFSEEEVQAMLDYYGPHENDDQIKLWYNNYRIGSQTSVYNPWSIISYIKNNRRLTSHWMNSANNNLIKEIIQKSPFNVKSDLELLMNGQTLEKPIIEFITFDSLYTSSDVVYNFLFLTGYLSYEKMYMDADKNNELFSLMIPNKEVLFYHQQIITQWIEETINFSTYQSMLKDLTSGNVELFKETFVEMVETSMSTFDATGKEPERFYHAFVLGMLVSLQQTHEVKSNRESGTGRYDVMLIPKDINKIGIIIEFKKAKNETDEMLEAAAHDALTQINDRYYAAELKTRGITKIISLGIALRGKKTLIKEQIS